METYKNIVLVDDHAVVRSGLKELIEKLGSYKVSAQFDEGAGLLEFFHTAESVPDLVILDLDMPGMDGMETVRRLKEEEVAVPVLILTLNTDDKVIIQLFRQGVRGFLRKDCTAAMLKAALEAIFEYGYYHNEFLAYSLQHSEKAIEKSPQDDILEQLTEREKEFLRLVCDEREYTYDQIASEMHVQHRTVDGYRESIFGKFAIRSKTGLVLFVLKHRLFDHL